MKRENWMSVMRLIALAMVACSMAVLFRLHTQIRQNEQQAAELSEKVVQLQQENQRLQEDIDALLTDRGIRDVARKEMGMVASGEIVFRDVG